MCETAFSMVNIPQLLWVEVHENDVRVCMVPLGTNDHYKLSQTYTTDIVGLLLWSTIDNQ